MTMKPESSPPFDLQGGSLQVLSDNIPSGMFSCRLDEALTLLQVNNGFLSMLGYSRQDIRERFHDSFWNMIDPRDRNAAVLEARRQALQGPNKELEYRMPHRDGRIIWVLDKGRLIRGEDGTGYYCCVLVDITRNKELENTLRLSLERHQIIMDQTTDILFEWDILADTFSFSSNWGKKFESAPITRNVSLYLEHAPHVFPEDQPAFASLLTRIRGGERYLEEEMRLIDAGGEIVWCRMRLTGLMDESGRVVRAVGVIVDIDVEKRNAQVLLERVQRDTLTHLYNKGACQERVEQVLAKAAPGVRSAMMILDMDDFKKVNDTRGHLFGDALLAEAARILQKQFRGQDIVGRIGGDEFLVFLSGIPDISVAEQKAERAMRALGDVMQEELEGVALSYSIGISAAPECGSTYHELFQSADQALYRAKSLGKNQYSVYDPKLPAAGFPLQIRSAVSTPIDSDEGRDERETRLVEYVFHILYKSTDLDAAVNSILELVGRHFDVSRVYIFENEEDGRCCTNTFEWCGEGVEPQKDLLQKVRYLEDLGGTYQNNFDENGVFYCRDVAVLEPQQYEILAPQGIKSMLQCAIYDNGKFSGYVGFDECRVNRFWTQEQVHVLALIAEILSIFLLKMRAQDQAVQNAQAMEAILDSQSSWIYVVRPRTFEMLYINRKTLDLVPELRAGMRCYDAFYHRDSPCDFCPAKDLLPSSSNDAKQIYNPFLKVWTSTDACWINWKGEDAILLTCHDITAVKMEAEALQKELESRKKTS